MAESQDTEIHLPNPVEMSQTLVDIAQRSQHLVTDFVKRQTLDGTLDVKDTANLSVAFMEMTQRLLANPARLAESQLELWQGYLSLWQRSTAAFMGQQVEPTITPERGDRRFKHEDWEENFVFDYIKQAYLLTARWLQSTVQRVEGLDDKTRDKLEFYTRQFVDALSPTNFPITNPEVLRATLESGGENLLNGLKNLLEDLERGKGRLSIKMTDLDAFELGKNVATTPGKVVYQNELMQLIQYTPTTETVYKRPFMVVPPWINKYYILDLRPKNSFIKWWVDQGFTVFVISWVNPDEKLSSKNFEDYLALGPLTAMDKITEITGEHEINALGYCLGGTLLTATKAYLAAKGDKRIQSGTFMTTMLDFSKPGDLGVFIDEEQISSLEEMMKKRGYLDGGEMATTFNMLRANDLIWSFFVNNYLLGKDPFPFDLLYWNSDSTRMPATMHSFYLRTMYQKNLLIQPGAVTLLGEPIELGKIKQPAYFLSTIEDHIAPWKSTYMGARHFSGKVRFVLGGSGHIAGAINPPVAGKYGFWVNTQLPAASEEWLGSAEKQEGSWWLDWLEWIKPMAGEQVPAREPGGAKFPPLEDAPGSYVKLRIV